MCSADISQAFKAFEDKYQLAPVFQVTDGRVLGAFIMTKSGESFIISFESSDDDIAAAARFLAPDNFQEALADIHFLKSLCSAPSLRHAAPSTLQ